MAINLNRVNELYLYPRHYYRMPLSRLSDIFWNRERVSAQMNGTDAATVAHALRALSGYTGKDWLKGSQSTIRKTPVRRIVREGQII